MKRVIAGLVAAAMLAGLGGCRMRRFGEGIGMYDADIADGAFGPYDEDWRDEEVGIPVKKQIEVLQELGITITNKQKEMVRSSGAVPGGENVLELMPYELILMLIGMGEYDYETFTWTPTSDQVFYFDAEMFELESMYLLCMDWVMAITGDDFRPDDIAVDTSGADWEAGGGTQVLTFRYNGRDYRFEAEMNDDWLDVRVFTFLNEVLQENGKEKCLLGVPADQGAIVFYNTEEWGREFTRKTGLVCDRL